MKRLALLMTGGAIWLFLAALPALADGGPHVSTINNGSLGINADSCAGCHRAHTAAGPYLINAADEEALCLTCHGASGTGSTVDVMTGVQYTLGTGTDVRGTTVLGALRNGGFDLARIDSSNVARQSYPRNANVPPDISQRPKVPVLAAGEPVTSSHLAMAENGLTNPGIAWGNGAFGDASVGPVVTLSCASCHNPHGNGQYRILNPVPEAHTGTIVVPAPVAVDDAALPGPGDTRNYTVIQNPLVDNDTQVGRTLLASQVVNAGYGPTDGDYFRRNVPWSPTAVDADCDPTVFAQPAGCTVATNNDAPNGLGTFNAQITAWCSQCHSRYLADGNTPAGNNPPYATDSGDPTFTYRHPTRSNRTCNVCHVAHGSNATMDGVYSSNFEYPDGTTFSASSRLLKVDNRGTCQSCHDPTETTVGGDYVGPLPTPGAP